VENLNKKRKTKKRVNSVIPSGTTFKPSVESRPYEEIKDGWWGMAMEQFRSDARTKPTRRSASELRFLSFPVN
jgi:hypothetical protein